MAELILNSFIELASSLGPIGVAALVMGSYLLGLAIGALIADWGLTFNKNKEGCNYAKETKTKKRRD